MSTNQKLAPGSEWIDDVTIVDAQGTITSIRPEASAVSIRNNDDGLNSESDEAWTADMLAIIDRANLDPVRTAARRLVDEIERFKCIKPGFDDCEVVEINLLEPELSELKAVL